jgi:hypothetical protein
MSLALHPCGTPMPKRTLNEILEEVQALTPTEQEQVREALDRLLAGRESSTLEDELERRLFDAGLLSEIRPPTLDLAPYRDRRPVEVTGKPLSEVIMEERR